MQDEWLVLHVNPPLTFYSMHVVGPEKKKKIFIVEDEEMFANLLRDFLVRKTEHDVRLFSTGESCLEEMHLNPDVIILDYYLNSKDKEASDGLEILRRLRNSGSKAHIIFLSGQTGFGVAMQSRFDGAQHYVIKDDQAFSRIELLIAGK
jgi:DNA-binding response OmpR family regulator